MKKKLNIITETSYGPCSFKNFSNYSQLKMYCNYS